jgi:hypothetical protein
LPSTSRSRAAWAAPSALRAEPQAALCRGSARDASDGIATYPAADCRELSIRLMSGSSPLMNNAARPVVSATVSPSGVIPWSGEPSCSTVAFSGRSAYHSDASTAVHATGKKVPHKRRQQPHPNSLSLRSLTFPCGNSSIFCGSVQASHSLSVMAYTRRWTPLSRPTTRPPSLRRWENSFPPRPAPRAFLFAPHALHTGG